MECPVSDRRFTVAIVGRPNVGKSTLFNRFLGERKAVVHDLPGVTRDRNYADVDWNRRVFTLIDTGGYLPESGDNIADAVGVQVGLAISDADVVLLVVDAQTGPTDIDQEMARLILKSEKPYVLVTNKVDSVHDIADAAGFYSLAMGDPWHVSALNGRGAGDLLDRVISLLPEGEEPLPEPKIVPRLAVIGRPNVGKSTFVNTLQGLERVVVSNIPGTTRDAIDLTMEREGRPFLLIDTAGLRRRARVKEEVEYYSGLRTTRSVERCDVAILLVDGEEGVTIQDIKIAEHAERLGKGVVLCYNKWDLIEKDSKTAEQTQRDIIARFPSIGPYPILFTSALTGQRAWRAIDIAFEVYDRRRTKIPTPQINQFIEVLNATTSPPTRRGRPFRVSYGLQAHAAPPTFLFFASRPQDIPEHYRRFLMNRLRESFDLCGTPIRLVFKKK